MRFLIKGSIILENWEVIVDIYEDNFRLMVGGGGLSGSAKIIHVFKWIV